MLSKKIVVVGATGLVGREMLKILNEEHVPCNYVTAAASERSEGVQLKYGNDIISVQNLEKIDFHNFDIALFSAGSAVSKIFAPQATQANCTVIDNTSFFRMQKDVPLVVPEINPNTISNHKIIANPNCSTIQMVLPLKPLHDAFDLQELVISTYQSASGAGQKGINELMQQTDAIMTNKQMKIEFFKKQLAFNLIPQIDVFDNFDYTKEELKMINETQKILNTKIPISATCVRVPVIRGHAVSVYAKFKKNVSNFKELLANFSGIKLLDDPKNSLYATPIDSVGKNEVFVSRLRIHQNYANCLSFMCFSDNIRKGAALNAVQIAKLLK